MAVDVRSLAELGAAARGFLTQSLPGAVARLVPNTFTVIAKVIALCDFENEQRRAYLFRQLFASTADELWLARHGYELSLARLPPSVAAGSVTVPATPGTVAPSGLTFVGDDGLTFTTVAGGTASGNSVTLPIEADLAGSAGNVAAGVELRLDPGSATPGLGAIGTVEAAGIGGGADVEPLERFRGRVLARKRRPPMGGSSHDYEAWAREALATVRDVWVDSFANDARSVWVAFTVTDTETGVPTAAQVAVVQPYLDDPARRPVTARVFAVAPAPLPVTVGISGLFPDTPEVRAAVAAELAAAFTDRAKPGTPTAPATFSRSWLVEAVGRATGEDRHVLVAPAADVVIPAGVLPVLGPIVYS